METAIWILKGVIALLFTFTGVNKIFLPKAKLLEKGMKGLIDLDEKQIKLAGLLEVAGAFGLILPTLLNIYPVLSYNTVYKHYHQTEHYDTTLLS